MGSARTREVSRRHLLAALAVTPAALGLLGGCTVGSAEPAGPDPLIALAEAARADAAVAAAAVAAEPALAPRLDPLQAARTEHAAALDAEITPTASAAPTTGPTSATPASATLADVRAAVQGSGEAAAAAALELPADRVGLVASIAACCSAYAAVLT